MQEIKSDTGINSNASPVLTYSFGILKWPKTNLENRSTFKRKLTKYCFHHRYATTERLMLLRNVGGRRYKYYLPPNLANSRKHIFTRPHTHFKEQLAKQIQNTPNTVV